ncbi:MAG: DUF444 family protein [Candidatus Dadabacteria bacterium]|nr:MAG: DUF444 family protein [Candidatus Dadabacteria bacterium]
MADDVIESNESEGLFNDFIENELEDLVEHIVNEGDLDRLGDAGSDIVIEMDDIVPPTFVYDDAGAGAGGRGRGPGREKDRLRFSMPYERFMELVARRLGLPNLTKTGQGRIKELSYTFRTFGPVGVVLDKRRTFRRALRSSIGLGVYDPDEGRYEVQFRRRDRRYKVPQRVERPRFKAVVFYMGDISYSTWGERLEMEKRLVGFIHHWLDYNYGAGNVDHRFFVHDVEAYEVEPEAFYRVSTAGGTKAAPVFELVGQVAVNEYDVGSTNFYAFYFGDGELFEDDASHIVAVLGEVLKPLCNRIGLVEVKPSRFSYLNREVEKAFPADPIVRLAQIKDKKETVATIQTLFGEEVRA